MNGAWHYHEAERLLLVATTHVSLGSAEQESALAQAAVHAQLATAAAAIDTHMNPRWEGSLVTQLWARVLHTSGLGGQPKE